ncbi:MAG TPA: Crp/Fnr family transcriptional regulator [Bacteroidales bacterium]|nr:Crp/Fnr family transcriptional regulator [Bacteroidales bacterium]
MNSQLNDFFENKLIGLIEKKPFKDLPTDTVILEEQSYIKEVPIVVEGRIKVRKMDESGREIILYHINPGESCILSITSCINNKPSNAEAITETETKIIAIAAKEVTEWMDEYKSWRAFVMKLYYSRLDELLSLVDNIAFKQIDFRLYEKLKTYQQSQGNEIKITHQQLAYELGTAREVVSRLLKQLEKKNLIHLERGVIKINSSL